MVYFCQQFAGPNLGGKRELCTLLAEGRTVPNQGVQGRVIAEGETISPRAREAMGMIAP